MKAFLDTMIWLHFRPVEDVDPAALGWKPEHTTIVVPRVTIEELDKHKSQHRNSRVRQRARTVLQLIEKAGNAAIHLKNGLALEVRLMPPSLQPEDLRLDSSRPDDRLVTAVMACVESEGGEVILYTDDTTPRLLAKNLGLNARNFPEALRLAEEPDPVEKENRELRTELKRLRTHQADLTCQFGLPLPPGKLLEVSLKKILPLTGEHLTAALVKIDQEFPVPHPLTRHPLYNPLQIGFAGISTPSPDEFARYDREVAAYREQIQQYLRDSYQHGVESEYATTLSIEITNSGKAPAEDVDLYLHFPDGCLVYEEMPDEPEAPAEPERPMSQFERLSKFTPSYVPSFSDLPDLGAMQRNFSLRKTNSYEATQKFSRIKHGHAVSVHPFVLTFASYAEARSFSIEYRITAANMPESVKGALNVKVVKS